MVNAQAKKRRRPKQRDLVQMLLGTAVLILINIIASYIQFSIDLTEEKRYTLSASAKKLVRNLDDIVYVKVYLEGDFPSGFKRLRNSTRDLLDQIRNYSGGNIEYEFINPSAGTNPAERKKIYRQLADKGLQPTTLEVKEGDASMQKVIFPGALVSYRSKELPLQLLKSSIGTAPEEMINNSIGALEYEMANTIRRLVVTSKPRIGFTEGHGELDTLQTADITGTLNDFYSAERVRIAGKIENGKLTSNLSPYNLIIIAKPDSAFGENEKFLLDQYIMHGGKVIWLVDKMNASMDSLAGASSAMATDLQLNLDDQLFRYGVRINPNLVLDLEAAPIPIVTGNIGNQPKTEFLPWMYFPLVFPKTNHPVVNNLNAVKCEFTSSIDTVGPVRIRKTILLSSSRYSKTFYSPVHIDLSAVKQKPVMAQYNQPGQPIAVLLEGAFESGFKNRVPEELMKYDTGFREKSENNSMIVVADGDIIKNQYKRSSGRFYPLGYDHYTGQSYGNKNFMLNCIDYLLDESGLISLRSKEVRLRLLDKTRLETERLSWQLLNTVLPVMAVALAGIIIALVRKRKYGK